MQLSLQSDYAFRTLIYLTAKPLASIREISESYEISYDHLVKVVNRLGKAGYVKLTKGKGGGIALKQPPEKICLADVYFDMQAGADLLDCFHPFKNARCIKSACDLKHAFNEANQAFIDALGHYSLKDVTESLGTFEKLGTGKRKSK